MKKNVKRLLTLVLALAMVCAMAPAALAAKGHVAKRTPLTEVAITDIETPSIGKPLDSEFTASTGAVITGVSWDPDDAAAKLGTYTLTVDLIPASGYTFSDSVKVTFMGKEGTILLKGAEELSASCVFTVGRPAASTTVSNRPTALSAVDVSAISAPEAGKPLDVDFNVTEGVVIADVSWNPPDTTAKPNTGYELLVDLEAAEKYRFSDSVKVTFMGIEGELLSRSAEELRASFAFPNTREYELTLEALTGTFVSIGDQSKASVFEVKPVYSGTQMVTVSWYACDDTGRAYGPALSRGNSFIIPDIDEADAGKTIYYSCRAITADGKARAELIFSCMLTPAGPMDDFYLANAILTLPAAGDGVPTGSKSLPTSSGDYTATAVKWYEVDAGKSTEMVGAAKFKAGWDYMVDIQFAMKSGAFPADTEFAVNGETQPAEKGRVRYYFTLGGLAAPAGFADVPAGEYYSAAVDWAVEKGITNGNGKNAKGEDIFSPDMICTRGHVVTFLWRTMGQPAPKSASTPFTDLKQDWYKTAVAWAVEQGITDGTSATTFSPDTPCSGAHIATFIYRAIYGLDASKQEGQPFYAVAGKWIEDNKLSADMDFSLTDGCGRADTVTFLYRYDALKKP